MASEDDTRIDNILNRLDQAWSAWLDALAAEQDDTKAMALMQETAKSDESAVEVIRGLVDEYSYVKAPAPDSVDDASSVEEARNILNHHHDRLMGALGAVSEMSEHVVEAVEERIAPLTWEVYETRASEVRSNESSST